MIGSVPHLKIPEKIRNFDICIMPYVLDSYTVGVNPLKILEYLALGKPVISSPIPAVKEFPGLVYVATGVGEWRGQPGTALSENDEAKFLARKESACGQGYGNRIDQLLALCREFFASDRDMRIYISQYGGPASR
jgi:hypothetical protein